MTKCSGSLPKGSGSLPKGSGSLWIRNPGCCCTLSRNNSQISYQLSVDLAGGSRPRDSSWTGSRTQPSLLSSCTISPGTFRPLVFSTGQINIEMRYYTDLDPDWHVSCLQDPVQDPAPQCIKCSIQICVCTKSRNIKKLNFLQN